MCCECCTEIRRMDQILDFLTYHCLSPNNRKCNVILQYGNRMRIIAVNKLISVDSGSFDLFQSTYFKSSNWFQTFNHQVFGISPHTECCYSKISFTRDNIQGVICQLRRFFWKWFQPQKPFSKSILFFVVVIVWEKDLHVCF